MPETALRKTCMHCGTEIISPQTHCPTCGFPAVRRPGPPAKTVILILLAVVSVGLIAIFALIHTLVTSTGAYEQAITIASQSPEARKLLGDNISARVPAIGSTLGVRVGQFVQFSVGLTGSRGSGRLYAVANAINSDWEFSRLTLRLSGASESVDITPAPRAQLVPPVPDKKVYLLPVGLDPGESLSWAPKYYLAKFGIPVEVLAPIPVPPETVDRARRQVDSERLLLLLGQKYPDLAKDPANILIAVTSRDIFIRSFGWSFAQNYRHDSRFAVVSSARARPTGSRGHFLNYWNPEWLHSRLQKLLSKNIAVLYFDLPMSDDYTSLLAFGNLSGTAMDRVSGSIIGAEGQWDPSTESDHVVVSTVAVPNQPPIWHLADTRYLPQTSAHVMDANLTVGIFIYRRADFILDGNYPLKFSRAYATRDQHSHSFGIGANDSLDLRIERMGTYIDLVMEDGARAHFNHVGTVKGTVGDVYQTDWDPGSPFSHSRAILADHRWTVERNDGWKVFFTDPPQTSVARPSLLTGFSDLAGRLYPVTRNESGDLVSVATPAGPWLQFKADSQHRIESISDTSGRTVNYIYDSAGRLAEVVASDGNHDRYAYDDESEMLSIHSNSVPVVVNTYDASAYITSQTLSDGGQFQYHYIPDTTRQPGYFRPDLIRSPNDLVTHIRYQKDDDHTLSLPSAK